jgi:energy-coupling factor transporter ATP-binding protein EcfA2
MRQGPPRSPLIGRQTECRKLTSAIKNRESFLVWGPADAGKTTLTKMIIGGLPEPERRNCIYWTGAASVRQLVAELVRGLFVAGDALVRNKVRQDGCGDGSLNRWLRDQTSGRLKVLLYSATKAGRYWIFLDHFPPATHTMAGFIKQIIWRCKTPVYLLARGCSHAEIGYAWSIYFTPQYHVSLGPLPDSSARELLEHCIHRFELSSLDLQGFREEMLRLSQHNPGSIVKMSEMASNARYQYGDQIKLALVHVDYLMRAGIPNGRFGTQ